MENINEVYDFYNQGAEIGRLERGLGIVEFYRTKEIIEKYLSDKKYVIYDVGGGIGKYSEWLARKGHDVTLLELAPYAVEYAIKNQKDIHYQAKVGDARELEMPDNSADIVLLMGPLYHLQEKEERYKVLKEAHRVLKRDGLLFAVGISKFSSMSWALSEYGRTNTFIDDDIYFEMLEREIKTGRHVRPKEYPRILSNAFFHTIDELKSEIAEQNFIVLASHAIEGCIWFTPDLNEKWKNENSRRRLLNILHQTEQEDTLMGMSPHFMVVAKK